MQVIYIRFRLLSQHMGCAHGRHSDILIGQNRRDKRRPKGGSEEFPLPVAVSPNENGGMPAVPGVEGPTIPEIYGASRVSALGHRGSHTSPREPTVRIRPWTPWFFGRP